MLHLHTAGRIEPLAEHLAEVLTAAPTDPMVPEWIAVPSVGMRRWLNLELARHLGASGPGGDGISANIRSAFPGSLRLAVLDSGRHPDDPDPWRVERLVWSVLAVLHTAAEDPLLAAVCQVPAGSSSYGRARRIADHFDQYHVHRADMVRAWSQHRDIDGSGRELPPHQRWQPHLWRLVRARVGSASPPERLPALLDQLHDRLLDDEPPVDLPERLVMFGLSVLPGGAGFLDLAHAVGAHRELHVFMVEPSPAVAAKVRRALPPPGDAARARIEDRSASVVAHPLLRSWGRLHRETTVLLVDGERETVPAAVPVDRVGETAEHGTERTLLGRFQADLRQDRAPTADLVPDPADRSIEFHATHGATRQVEVLRDVLLQLLADDELALDEDDVLVVSPALDQLAPVIESVLGPSAEHPGSWDGATPALRYRIADRSIRSTNPVLGALDALLGLVGGRFDAPSVLDFIALAPVRHRFRLGDDDLARIGEWVSTVNVRWGLDERHRATMGVPAAYDTNTWRAAVDRLMLGLAVDEQRSLAFGDVVPLGLGGDDAALAGRFAQLLWRLRELADQTAHARPVDEWFALVRAAVQVFLAVPREAAWQVETLQRMLGELQAAASVDGQRSDVPLEFADLRRLLADRLADEPGRPDFFRGGITVSSMTPLRWVPHRVIVAVGVDQHAFSVAAPDGDDLVATAPLIGDRDRRGESRQSLLETVLSARDRLVIIREGHDVRTNHPVPAAVPVAELGDAVLAMVDPAHRGAVRERLEVAHPRQPFDETVFLPGALVPERPWGFDASAYEGALARRRRSDESVEFRAELLSAPDDGVIELAELQAYFKDPVGHFLGRRLGLRLPRPEEAPAAHLPLKAGALDRWALGDSLFNWLLEGGTVAQWQAVERRLGRLEPGVIGDATMAEVTESVEALMQVATDAGVRFGPPTPVPVGAQLPDGTRVIGTVEDRLGGERPGPARLTYSSVRPAFRLSAWLDLMAVVGTDPAVPWRSVGVHRSTKKGDAPVLVELEPAGAGEADARRRVALAALEVAVDCYRRGCAEPLPLFPRVSHAAWSGEYREQDWRAHRGGGDVAKPLTALVYGSYELDDLRRIPRRDGDPIGERGPDVGRLECFGEYLWGAIEASIVEHDEAGAGAPAVGSSQ